MAPFSYQLRVGPWSKVKGRNKQSVGADGTRPPCYLLRHPAFHRVRAEGEKGPQSVQSVIACSDQFCHQASAGQGVLSALVSPEVLLHHLGNRSTWAQLTQKTQTLPYPNHFHELLAYW